ncbi:MAG TPA: glycosyltransferase family 9 protein [Steroidobacteraceae bacterium]|nr:glycosyltransferase family 9 protein [Steroidobacteraceae bacterium]
MTDTASPPSQLCILRLSALGDTCHLVPIVRTLQQAWPATRLSWVIGRVEAKLLRLLPEVEFITIDKRSVWRARRELAAALAGRRFDALLHMQLSLRASLLSTAIPATRRIGFDRARARELQWLFTNERIEARRDEHVLDSFFGFVRALGIDTRVAAWTLPVPPADRAWAAQRLPGDQPTLIISPCSSHRHRNWPAARYAEFARHAQQRHGLRVVLCGGRSGLERDYGAQIEALAGVPLLNLIGQDTLPQLLALLERATVLLGPDSGPAHMATLVGTPVIGLYAATRLQRSGPYLSRQWCVDRYELAAQRFRGKPAAQLPWAEKIEEPGVMELIETAAACERLDALLAAR